MIFDAQVVINGPKEAIWALLTDIENAANTIHGIQSVDVLERPAQGLVGLRWRETRMLFGKPASVVKWITDAVDCESYTTRAESDGLVHVSTTTIAEGSNGTILTSTHESLPQGTLARLMSIPMGFLFRGVAARALLQDLNDIKAAIERA